MFYFLKGTIYKITPQYIVLETNATGYIIYTSNPYFYKVGESVLIYVYEHIVDAKATLYGFETEKHREMFLKLINVSGVGPKAGLVLISKNIESLEKAIFKKDLSYLQTFPGIGPKTSKQIIFELSGNITSSNENLSSKLLQVTQALKNLGYNANEINKVKEILIENQDKDIGEIIKIGLQNI